MGKIGRGPSEDGRSSGLGRREGRGEAGGWAPPRRLCVCTESRLPGTANVYQQLCKKKLPETSNEPEIRFYVGWHGGRSPGHIALLTRCVGSHQHSGRAAARRPLPRPGVSPPSQSSKILSCSVTGIPQVKRMRDREEPPRGSISGLARWDTVGRPVTTATALRGLRVSLPAQFRTA